MIEEWQKHVIKEGHDTFCGEVEWGFALQGFDHAVNCILSGDRLLPCPKCWSAMLKLAEEDASYFVSEERVR